MSINSTSFVCNLCKSEQETLHPQAVTSQPNVTHTFDTLKISAPK